VRGVENDQQNRRRRARPIQPDRLDLESRVVRCPAYRDAVEALLTTCRSRDTVAGLVVTSPKDGRSVIEAGFRSIREGV